MADELNITQDLASRFSQLGEIKTVADRLQDRLEDIAAANVAAAGTDDQYARNYRSNVDGPTQDLNDLAKGIGSLFDTTGANGQSAVKTFGDVDDDSAAAAGNL